MQIIFDRLTRFQNTPSPLSSIRQGVRRHRFALSSSLLLLLCLGAMQEAAAKTIIVAPNGNNNNPGTVAKPVATPKQALNMAESGDTIYLRAGRYAIERFLWIDKASLTISSYPNERAAIVGGTEESEKNPTSIIVAVANNISILNLDIEGGSYYGIKVDVDKEPATRGVIIRGCRIKNTGRDCIKTFNADGLIIEDCEIGPSGVRDASNAEGIDSIGSVGVTIRNCYVHDVATCGIYLKGGARDGVVERNRVERSGHAGILLGQDTDLEFMRDGTKYECLNSVARNNVVVDTQAAGIGTYSGSNVRFENNTVVGVAKASQSGFYVVTNSREVPAKDVFFKNNIVVVGDQRPVVFTLDVDGQFVCDSNIYFSRSKPAGDFRRESRKPERYDAWNFVDWKRQLKIDARSQLIDPLLDAADLYRPRAGSPAFDKGETLADLKTDYSGAARPQGAAFDIGAHEGRGYSAPARTKEDGEPAGATSNAEREGSDSSPGSRKKQLVAAAMGALCGGGIFTVALLVRSRLMSARNNALKRGWAEIELPRIE